MKKTLLYSCLTFTLCSCSDSDVQTFYALVTITGSVLGIILFFKIWGMTDDVRALRKKIAPEYEWETIPKTTTLTETQNYKQDFAIGERIKSKSFNKAGIVKDFYNGIYDVDIDGKIYTLRADDVERL